MFDEELKVTYGIVLIYYNAYIHVYCKLHGIPHDAVCYSKQISAPSPGSEKVFSDP